MSGATPPAGALSRTIAAPLLVGLLLRLAMLWFVEVRIVNDAASYDLAAIHLLEHGVFTGSTEPPFEPTAYRPPLYPAFLAIVYGIAGHRLLAAQLAQILLSLGLALLLSRAVEKLEPGLGIWVLWGLALCPFDAVYTVVLLSESLASFLLGSAFALWVLIVHPRWRWVVLGLGIGFATLCRDIYIALGPFLGVLWVATTRGPIRERVLASVLVFACALAPVAPWTVRNRVQLGRWIPVSAGRLGLSLWMGGWATTAGSIGADVNGVRVWSDSAFLDPSDRARIEATEGDVLAQDRVYRELFFERVRREPHRVIGRWLIRVPLLWLGTRFDIFDLNPRVFPYGSRPWTIAKIALFGINTFYVLAALAGLLLAIRRRRAITFAAVPLVFTALVYLPLNSFENRYSQPVYPFLVVLGALALRAGWARVRTFRASHAAPGSDSVST